MLRLTCPVPVLVYHVVDVVMHRCPVLYAILLDNPSYVALRAAVSGSSCAFVYHYLEDDADRIVHVRRIIHCSPPDLRVYAVCNALFATSSAGLNPSPIIDVAIGNTMGTKRNKHPLFASVPSQVYDDIADHPIDVTEAWLLVTSESTADTEAAPAAFSITCAGNASKHLFIACRKCYQVHRTTIELFPLPKWRDRDLAG